MVEIKTAYLEEYKESLLDEIMIRYEDEQQDLLMALIKGMNCHKLCFFSLPAFDVTHFLWFLFLFG